jgi:hypothetical protein
VERGVVVLISGTGSGARISSSDNPIMRRHLVMLVPLLALLSESLASAQIFGSAGIGQTSDDAADRFPIADRTPVASVNTLIEAGTFVSARVGVAAELLKASDLSASTTGDFGVFEAVEKERALTVTMRIKAVQWHAAALELLGGGGVVCTVIRSRCCRQRTCVDC